MSRIEELIREKCPDGVEYLSLLSVANVLYGYPCDALLFNTKNNGKPLARIRDVLSGMSDTYTTEIVPKKYELTNGDLLVGMDGNFHVAKWKTDGGILCQRVCKIYSKDEDNVVINGYLSHILGPIIKKIEDNKPSGTVKHLLDKDIKSIEIPVPPIQVQQEIVRILDKFTELEAELQAELDARKKQYEHYRDMLIENVEGRRGKLIEMLCQPVTDGPHTTPKLVAEGIPFISATAIHEGRIHFEDAQGFITKEFDDECAKKYKPKRDDVYLVKSGSTTGKVGYVDTDIDFNIWSPLAAMRVNNENSARYLFHLLQTQSVQFQVSTRMSHGSQPNLSMRVLEQFDVVIPTLQEQISIVNILEKYDTLCNDRETGLPAEIAARHKQYEYYRDKLLTFKRKEV